MFLQEMIREASPILYHATYFRSFFRTVHILIPDSWGGIIEANQSSWESFEVLYYQLSP